MAAHPGRRVWRVMGLLGLGAVAVLAVVVAWGRGSEGGLDPVQATVPFLTASPTPTRSGLVLAADPFLTDGDWSQITVGELVVRSDDQPRRLSPCLADPRGLGADVTKGAAYVQPDASGIHPPGRGINEFLLLYVDETSATRAVTDIRDQIERCAQPMSEMTDFSTFPILPETPIAEGFDAGGDAGGVHHHVTVARNGTVVVIVESTGWADRTFTTMNLAMVRAIPSEGQRCPIVDIDVALCVTITPTPAFPPTPWLWSGDPQTTWTSSM